jgi:hypothetical protein
MKRDITWFLDLYQNEQLNLDPPYQRRSVWTVKDRKFFLDTIFRKYPSPAVFLHKEIDSEKDRMIYHVVDGKQRLETVIRFSNNDIAIDKDYGDEKLDGKKWKQIENDPDLKMRFLHYAVPVEFMESDDSTVINEVFDRLNRNSRKLERQEMRHAKYDGWFIKVAEREAEQEEWERFGIVTKARMRRMKDVQLISELLVILLKNSIQGYDQDTLDDIYAEYDSPGESVSQFDELAFESNLQLLKDYMLRMENHNSAVSKYAKGLNNFFSLWAFLALNRGRLKSPADTADAYADFMTKVTIVSREKDLDAFLSDHHDDLYAEAFLYLKSSVRASTDKQQRIERNKILESVLLSNDSQEEIYLSSAYKYPATE